MTSNFGPDDQIRGRALGAAIEPEPRAATDREKWIASLEERACLLEQLEAANRDLDTARRERNLMLWCCVVLLCTACWLAGRVMAIGAGQ